MADQTSDNTGMLLIISGPSGVGKTTITRAVEKAIPASVFSVSVTTRPRTPADQEGVDYFFLNDEQFDRMVESDELLEHANVFGKKYGTPSAWVDSELARGKIVILEIDVHGAEQVKAKRPEAFALFIEPPSEQVLLERLRARQREDEATIQRRFAEAKREIARARSGGVYDAFLVNSELNQAIGEAVQVVNQARAALRARA